MDLRSLLVDRIFWQSLPRLPAPKDILSLLTKYPSRLEQATPRLASNNTSLPQPSAWWKGFLESEELDQLNRCKYCVDEGRALLQLTTHKRNPKEKNNEIIAQRKRIREELNAHREDKKACHDYQRNIILQHTVWPLHMLDRPLSVNDMKRASSDDEDEGVLPVFQPEGDHQGEEKEQVELRPAEAVDEHDIEELDLTPYQGWVRDQEKLKLARYKNLTGYKAREKLQGKVRRGDMLVFLSSKLRPGTATGTSMEDIDPERPVWFGRITRLTNLRLWMDWWGLIQEDEKKGFCIGR